jgi:hypothetical protein|tara:strand:- start:447 stop:629 length:183 start_codon:yes stop_codon:yes gene_type:complete
MKVRISIQAIVEQEASWIPSDGDDGIQEEIKDMVTDAIEQCLFGLEITNIKVSIHGRTND